MSLKRYKLLITLVLPLLFLAACADKSVEVANNATSTKELINYSKSLEKQGHYHLSKGLASNQDPICQIYVDALNTYGIVDDFFKAPMQPNSPEFGYPKWEQLDIYEYIDAFMKAHKYMYDEYYSLYYDDEFINASDMRNTPIMDENQSEEVKAQNRRDWQMYYTRVDIYNNGELKNVLRLDRGRYYNGTFSSTLYNTFLIIFSDKSPKTFEYIDKKRDLFVQMMWEWDNYDIFFYNGKTYVKQTSFEAGSGKVYIWFDLYIHIYVGNKYLDKFLCYIE